MSDEIYREDSLGLVRASGAVVWIEPERWAVDSEGGRFFAVTREAVQDESWFVNKSPPTEVHVPVETRTAAENIEEKSEIVAFNQLEVTRYSVVVNTSDSPDSVHDLNPPVVQLDTESKSVSWLDMFF